MDLYHPNFWKWRRSEIICTMEKRVGSTSSTNFKLTCSFLIPLRISGSDPRVRKIRNEASSVCKSVWLYVVVYFSGSIRVRPFSTLPGDTHDFLSPFSSPLYEISKPSGLKESHFFYITSALSARWIRFHLLVHLCVRACAHGVRKIGGCLRLLGATVPEIKPGWENQGRCWQWNILFLILNYRRAIMATELLLLSIAFLNL